MCLPSAESYRISARDSAAAEVAEQEVAGRGRALNFTLTLVKLFYYAQTIKRNHNQVLNLLRSGMSPNLSQQGQKCPSYSPTLPNVFDM